MQMCHAFAAVGVEVELVIPTRQNALADDPFAYYGLTPNFRIQVLRTPDTVRFGKWGFIVHAALFGIACRRHLARVTPDAVYSRDELPLLLAGNCAPRFWEVHTDQYNRAVRWLVPKLSGLVSITHGLKQYYLERGIPSARILVAPDAVDLAAFAVSETQHEARERLGLPKHKRLALYTGHLYAWKGVYTLAAAARVLAETAPDVQVVFVGGTEEDVATFRAQYGSVPNISILGQQPHQDIPYYLRAADVVVLPNSAKSTISRLYTSPMKLFEYLASGTSIVASDLPSIREVLSDDHATLVPPDNPAALAQGIMHALETPANPEPTQTIAARFTWTARAERVLAYVEKRSAPV